jgi:hypothetical protein
MKGRTTGLIELVSSRTFNFMRFDGLGKDDKSASVATFEIG